MSTFFKPRARFFRMNLKYQREDAPRETAQFNGIVSGGPATARDEAMACTGPPDTTLFIMWSTT